VKIRKNWKQYLRELKDLEDSMTDEQLDKVDNYHHRNEQKELEAEDVSETDSI
jgi:hypothetical protein